MPSARSTPSRSKSPAPKRTSTPKSRPAKSPARAKSPALPKSPAAHSRSKTPSKNKPAPAKSPAAPVRARSKTSTKKSTKPPTEKNAYAIILPVYNESANLPIILHLIHETFTTTPNLSISDVSVTIVEDNSPDGTREIAHKCKDSYESGFIHVLERPGKMGLGSAYLDALETTDSPYVILMDADLSHHPKFIPQFIELLSEGNHDVVTGTRYRLGGGVAGWDFKRKLMSKGANFIADFLLRPGVSDLTGSFRLYKREVLEEIFPKIVSKGYVFQMEVMVRIVDAGYSVGEVGISFVDRIYGESKLGAGEIVGYLKGLAFLFFTT